MRLVFEAVLRPRRSREFVAAEAGASQSNCVPKLELGNEGVRVIRRRSVDLVDPDIPTAGFQRDRGPGVGADDGRHGMNHVVRAGLRGFKIVYDSAFKRGRAKAEGSIAWKERAHVSVGA